MVDKVYIEGEGLVNLTTKEKKALNARRKTNATWRTEALRTARNKKLADTDWIVIKEKEENGIVQNFSEWKKYRQELRDITKKYKSLADVKWPEEPSS